MGRIDEAVAVLVDQWGSPTRFKWREKEYQVGPRAVRYFARANWWTGERVDRGIGSGVIEVEMWRLLASSEEGKSSFELLHNTLTNSWKLIRRFE